MKDLPNNFKSRYTLGDDLGSGAYSVVKVYIIYLILTNIIF